MAGKSCCGQTVVVSGGGGIGAVQVADTETVDLEGDGTPGAPITADLLLSADADNQATTGSDGALFVPPVAPTGLTVADTDTVDLTLAGTGASGNPYVVSGNVTLDEVGPTGLGGLVSLQGAAPGTFINVPLAAAFTLPAGTWMVMAQVRADLTLPPNSAAHIVARLVNDQTSAVLVHSQVVGTASVYARGTAPLNTIVTFAGATTIRLEAARFIENGDTTNANINDNALGNTRLMAFRIS